MRKVFLSGCVLVLACLLVPPVRAAGDVNFLIGLKAVDDDQLEPADEGGVVGAVTSFGAEGWPIRLAADALLYADSDEVPGLAQEHDFSVGIVQVAGGIRKIFLAGGARPYVGGGLEVAFVGVEDERRNLLFLEEDEGSGAGLGLWLGGGVFWRLGNRFNLGFDARWSSTEVDVEFDPGADLEDVEVGGFTAGLTLGFGW